jgi:zinc/manganese transport system substrate-binding protein
MRLARQVYRPLAAVAAAAAVALAAGCSTAASGSQASGGGSGKKIAVVAAENFWGSIARQLGGSHVTETSIITNPDTDPHDYEPTAADARTLAGAQLAVVNGIGYDPWASKLLAANPVGGRVVLDVGRLTRVAAGGNPHRWYSPADVQKVIGALVADYARLDPKHAAYFRRREAMFESRSLAAYRHELATIARRYHGVAIGASESIVAPLAQALHLRLLTPASFLNAVSEGTEPTAADETTIARQISRRQIKVWVYNSQNGTPDVKRITDAATRRGIPVVTVTETPTPASATFQAWQVRQLRALAAALAEATRR